MSVQQHSLTVFIPLEEGQTEPVRSTLTAIGRNLHGHPTLSFHKSPNTHFARFVVIPGQDTGRPDRLLFSSNYDGNEPAYLAELCSACGIGLDQIFQHCKGYPAHAAENPARFAEYIRSFSMNPNFLFVSLPGLSVRTIQDDGEIGEVVEDFLDKVDSEAFSRLRRAAGVLPDPHRSRILQKKQNFVNSLLKVVERLAGIETGGSNPNTTVPAPGSITTLEDRHIQNPLTIFGTVKDSILARLILHALFWVGRFWFFLSPPWGALEGVTSIHFARWTICDGGDSLLFESNYDGSWDSYIDNFVDVTGPGLNRIWGNCKGFPRLGTADINSFKECVRAHQHPALVFYSAYPDLTVKNIIANHTLDMAVQAFIRTPDIDRVFAGSYEIND